MKQRLFMTPEAAEGLGVQALAYIAEDAERLRRFLAVTGIGPREIRAASGQPGFLVGVLEHVAANERLLTAFAADAAINPADIGKALAALGAHWEREIP
jgi:Protein of unknown function (DUF3572)